MLQTTLEQQEIISELNQIADSEQKKTLSYFFKSTPGSYAEDDLFMGIKVPYNRAIARQHLGASLQTLHLLLQSPYHEQRMCAALILVEQFKKTHDIEQQQALLNFYIEHHLCFNNWDLVDLSAPYILGAFMKQHGHQIMLLTNLANSGDIWQQRIAIVSTVTLIRNNDFDCTLLLADILLHHPHDLIQKAVGWMLREVGKKNYLIEYHFLCDNQRYQTMPRTMLRYAIERFEPNTKKAFLKGLI